MVIDITSHIESIRAEIKEAELACGRSAGSVKLMGVTKYHPVEMMTAAAGLLDLIGENKVQEACSKRADWPKDTANCPWHLIGHLQRNKIRRALECFQLIESVDALDTAIAINRVLSENEHETSVFPIFIEVNMSREAAKSGIPAEEADILLLNIQKLCPLVSVEGLMTVAANTKDEAELRGAFGGLRELRDRLSAVSGLPLRELSMGMSGDFRTAVEEGSTIVRIGSAIFGERNYG